MNEMPDNRDTEIRVGDALAPYLRQGPVRERSTNSDQPHQKSVVREWIESLAFTIIFVLIFTSFIAQATQVPTESMKPAIMVGDHFFLDKLAFPANYPAILGRYLPARALERGDIIAFRAPDDGNIPFVKRIIGVPGDVVDIRDKIVFVNGEELDEPYKIHVDTHIYRDEPWTPEGLRVRDNYGPVTLPDDAYFVMGDNRDNSNDGRYWGFINREDVIGKPLFVYWSYEGGSYVPGRRSIREKINAYGAIAANFFSDTRWFRMGLMIR
jgi:signal peptidase I